MRRSASAQHYFTVRGRGFDDIQWRSILEATGRIVERATELGIGVSLESDALHLTVSPKDDGMPLTIVRRGEPNAPREVTTEGPFDSVVQSVFSAIKKIAPDLFEMTCPDGRDYRRVLARAKAEVGSKEQAFQRAVSSRKFRNPATGGEVKFVSLPKKEQTKIRHQWEAQYGKNFDKAKAKAKAEAKDVVREKAEADEAAGKFKKQRQKAEKAKTLKSKKATTMKISDGTIRKAAIRVAANTTDPQLKRAILEILRDASFDDMGCDQMACGDVMGCGQMACGDDEKMSRHEEGKSVDIGTWLKENGHDDAAAKWEQHEGEIGNKAAATMFPEIRELAWQNVLQFMRENPESKTASGSTAHRAHAADRLTSQWVHRALQTPARVRACLRVPAEKLAGLVAKAQQGDDLGLLVSLLMAKHIRS